jgi:predicted O-methyltransferase YrrM
MPELRFSNPVLESMYVLGEAKDVAGNIHSLHSMASVEYANALYRTVRKYQPTIAVEIGMAYGGSTLAILTALAELGGASTLISVDPFQTTEWSGVGIASVQRAGLGDYHQLIEQPDYLALPHLIEQGMSVDFAYIDGWHTFDYTLLDFWYIDRMLRVGGIVAFNDCGWRAVHKVLRFVKTHRKYKEIDVGLRKEYAGGKTRLVRRVLDMQVNDRYFQKQQAWEPRWDFYAAF